MIHLKENDDQRTVVTVRNRNSFRTNSDFDSDEDDHNISRVVSDTCLSAKQHAGSNGVLETSIGLENSNGGVKEPGGIKRDLDSKVGDGVQDNEKLEDGANGKTVNNEAKEGENASRTHNNGDTQVDDELSNKGVSNEEKISNKEKTNEEISKSPVGRKGILKSPRRGILKNSNGSTETSMDDGEDSEVNANGDMESNAKSDGVSDTTDSPSSTTPKILKKSPTLPPKLADLKSMEWDELDELLQVERVVEEGDKLYQTMPVHLPSQSSVESNSSTPSNHSPKRDTPSQLE